MSLVLLVLSAADANGQSQSIAPDPKRNLATYDNGGEINFGWHMGPLACEEGTARIREFLWTHWAEKKKGRIRHSSPTIDVGPVISSFFVEQNKNGEWIVTEVITRCDCMLGRSGKLSSQITIYDDIQRVETITDAREPVIPKPVPPADKRNPKTYALRLKAKDPADDFIL